MWIHVKEWGTMHKWNWPYWGRCPIDGRISLRVDGVQGYLSLGYLPKTIWGNLKSVVFRLFHKRVIVKEFNGWHVEYRKRFI